MSALPEKIGRYQIKSLIGRGGMGDLYLAHDPNTNRLVTIKLLNATLDSAELRERFAREGRALAALNHPNIVNIYDSGEFEDSPFIVMEYVRGETLDELIKRRAPLSVPEKLKLMAELCAGLAQAHDAGIIHRDIKPANLMVDQQGRLKILDFGIARFAETNKTRVGLPLTQVNMIIGTPGYMSPEQIEGGTVDHRSDIFAVGAVCYELLSYNEAFAGGDTQSIERRVLQAQPTPLTTIQPGLDPDIDEIVLRAMKRDPNKRFQDAATFERALERVRARLTSQPVSQPTRRPTPPAQSLSGAARQARAEAAYQRAVAARDEGSIDAARRFAVEAVAEDPSHAQARALLARLEPRRAVPPTVQSSSTSPQATIVDTSIDGPASTVMSAPTVIVTPSAPQPKARPAPKSNQPQVQGKARSQNVRDERSRSLQQLWQQYPLLWKKHQKPIIAGAAALIAVAIVGIAIWAFVLGPTGELLTIARPVGGTVTAPGINCGTRGSNCTTKRPSGEAIELVLQADAGFAFDGYTGDCAPGGRTLMNGPRNCGVNFIPIVKTEGIDKPMQVLTISPVPTGGTIDGLDILCGTKGSICTANYPEGVMADLHPSADAGFTFMGFTGDCVPLGHTQMTGSRTCSATFSSVAEIAKLTPPPPPPPPKTKQGGASPGGPQSGPGGEGTRPPDSAGVKPLPPPPPGGNNTSKPVVSAAADQGPVAVPPTDGEFAKGKIKELLKAYCDAHEALDPVALKNVFPSLSLESLRNQLNPSKYRSVQCTVGEPTFVALNAEAGTARVRVEVKRVYVHTIQSQKPLVDEQIATMNLVRSELRSPWLIDKADYVPKPK